MITHTELEALRQGLAFIGAIFQFVGFIGFTLDMYPEWLRNVRKEHLHWLRDQVNWACNYYDEGDKVEARRMINHYIHSSGNKEKITMTSIGKLEPELKAPPDIFLDEKALKNYQEKLNHHFGNLDYMLSLPTSDRVWGLKTVIWIVLFGIFFQIVAAAPSDLLEKVFPLEKDEIYEV